MNQQIVLNEMIKGVEEMGGRFLQLDDNFVYFEVPQGSLIDDDERIRRVMKAFKVSFNLEVKLQYLN